ncbi:NUDIX domain-containing protein [Spirosoma soli]|uniref:NUDIX domain-containing protein n=1 Tax=Spirosoma soli TaxID=1770529 RepID=A0ABW5M783_9BACT
MPYSGSLRIPVALDCIIFGFDGETLNLLLVKRNFEPERGNWSLMGGFLDREEGLEEAAWRILYELTGLENVYMEQLQTFGRVDRDPAERTISVGYFALINIEQHNSELARRNNAYWLPLGQHPKLIFDHDEMVTVALQRLRYKAALHPIGFELLPEKFTLPQLQKLYEAIYDAPMDRRNFSRKILSTNLLIRTGEKDDKSVTKKGLLYSLDKEKYREQQHAFLNFINSSSLV